MERPHRPDHLHRRSHVGVVEHQRGAFAAELEQQRFMVRPPTSAMRVPTAGRTGERNHVDVAGLDKRFTGVRGRSGHDVHDTGREADVVQDADQVDHRQRVLRRRAGR